MSIIEFLEARIAEDEEVARAASPGPWRADVEGAEVVAIDGITVAEGFALSGPQLRATTAHIARHDPARVLAECKAKRAIIDQFTSAAAWAESSDCPNPDVYARQAGAVLDTCRHLAAVYADHPDYRDEWRP